MLRPDRDRTRATRPQRAALGLAALAVVAAAGCLEGFLEPLDTATTGGSSTADPTDTQATTGGAEASGLLGCASPPCTLVLVSQTLDDRIDVFDVGALREVLESRARARADKDWAAADAIRDQLKNAGIVVDDTSGGSTWSLDAGKDT